MKKIALMLFVTLPLTFFLSCSTTPKNITSIDASADASIEIATTRQDIDMEKANFLALLSPEKFKKAETNLENAEESLAKNKSSEYILKELAISRAWLEQAREVAQRSRPLMEKPLIARENAVEIAEANNKEIDSADKDFKKMTEKMEENKSIEQNKILDLAEEYLKAEKARTRRARLMPIEERIKEAKNLKAKKLVPVTYDHAILDYEAAKKTFEINPYDRGQVLDRIKVADESSKKLVALAAATNATSKKSPEQIVLEERQHAQIEKIKNEKMNNLYENSLDGIAEARLENERLKAEAKKLEEKAEPQIVLENLRQQIPEDQADIMMSPNGKIMLRLKEVQFKSGSADLSATAVQVLNNIKEALAEVDAKKIVIEGHTDSLGSKEKNKEISENRAQTVANFLQTEDSLKDINIEAIGLGSEMPIKNNKTQQGRAENRRVEITIETL